MSKEFGKAVAELAEEYGYDNIVLSAVNSKNSEMNGVSLIKGNNADLLTVLGASLLNDIINRIGGRTLQEILKAQATNQSKAVFDQNIEDNEEFKKEMENIVQAIKKQLGLR